MSDETALRFAAIRLRAARQQPYVATALFAMVPVESPGLGTFAVDGRWRVYVDPAAMTMWGVETSAAVLLHEVQHLLRDHLGRAAVERANGPLARLWNLAADAAINDDLIDDGILAADPVLPKHLGCESGLLEETYFRRLLGPRSQLLVTCGSGSGGDRLDVELDSERSGLDDLDAARIRRRVAHEVTDWVRLGNTASPGVRLWAESILDPQVPWQRLLRGAIARGQRSTDRPEPSWSRTHRRGDALTPFLRPGVTRHGSEIAVVIDTSASMHRRLLEAALTELDALLRVRPGRSIPVVVCDSHVQRVEHVNRLDQLELRGGGGTDLRPAIDTAAALQPVPDMIVVLTDGFTPWPTQAPRHCRLVVVLIGDEAPPPTTPGATAIRVEEPS